MGPAFSTKVWSSPRRDDGVFCRTHWTFVSCATSTYSLSFAGSVFLTRLTRRAGRPLIITLTCIYFVAWSTTGARDERVGGVVDRPVD